MRDIGFARRKDNPASRRRRLQTWKLEIVNDPLALQRGRDPDSERTATEQQDEQTIAADWASEYHLPALARALGSTRHDPFIKYPIEMTDRARCLLDTRKCSCAKGTCNVQGCKVSIKELYGWSAVATSQCRSPNPHLGNKMLNFFAKSASRFRERTLIRM
jgi:hypothetical protein